MNRIAVILAAALACASVPAQAGGYFAGGDESVPVEIPPGINPLIRSAIYNTPPAVSYGYVRRVHWRHHRHRHHGFIRARY